MLEAKAIVMLDSQELSVLNRLLIKESKKLSFAGKWIESQQLIIIADKLDDAREEFHREHNKYLAERYGLNENTAIGVAAE